MPPRFYPGSSQFIPDHRTGEPGPQTGTVRKQLNIDNPYFEGMVNQIYPSELQLNKANSSDTEASSWIYICLFLTALFHPKFMINVMTLILI